MDRMFRRAAPHISKEGGVVMTPAVTDGHSERAVVMEPIVSRVVAARLDALPAFVFSGRLIRRSSDFLSAAFAVGAFSSPPFCRYFAMQASAAPGAIRLKHFMIVDRLVPAIASAVVRLSPGFGWGERDDDESSVSASNKIKKWWHLRFVTRAMEVRNG